MHYFAGCGPQDRPAPRTAIVWAALIAILALHGMMVGYGAWRHSFTADEFSHLAAGLAQWRTGNHCFYRVNPPLVRMVAAIPVLFAGFSERTFPPPSTRGDEVPLSRLEEDFLAGNGPRALWLLRLARWACIPFTILGATVCFLWARSLYGSAGGLLAATLWCFSPTVLANAELITPDVGGAALGLAAGLALWRWLCQPAWGRALLAGLVLGLAELAKLTWVVLFLIWPLCWLGWSLSHTAGRRPGAWAKESAQLALVLALAIFVINAGYGFEGSFKQLGDFRFRSHALTGRRPGWGGPRFGNRLAEGCLARLPIPLPEQYVLGIDQQKADFDRGRYSYLAGQWRLGGWWYYYLYALAIKEPLGTWCLLLGAAGLSWLRPRYSAHWAEEMLLLLPAAAVVALVSSQTGFSHHLRYVLPALPFLFVWMGKLGQTIPDPRCIFRYLAALALAWSVASSAAQWPHSHAYFNELVGGPLGGHRHLHDSNIDWGQDLLDLKRWLDLHREARPMGLCLFVMPNIDLRIVGIDAAAIDSRPTPAFPPSPGAPVGPQPGWYAVSVNRIHHPERKFEYFLRFQPCGVIGGTIYIYHITLEEANRVRRELGLPEFDHNTNGTVHRQVGGGAESVGSQGGVSRGRAQGAP